MVGEEQQVPKGRKAANALRVVAVFMRQKYGIDVLNPQPVVREMFEDLFPGKPDVDENTALVGAEDSRIATTATGQKLKRSKHIFILSI
jgi:hypothetical protein